MPKWGIFNASLLLNEHGHPPFFISKLKLSFDKYSVDKVWTKICHFYFRGITLKTDLQTHVLPCVVCCHSGFLITFCNYYRKLRNLGKSKLHWNLQSVHPFEPTEVNFCFLKGPDQSTEMVDSSRKKKSISWDFNFTAHMILQNINVWCCEIFYSI